jgi:hypothetical protein
MGHFRLSSGNTFGVILHADFQLVDTGHPATPGKTIYCTGLGVVLFSTN